MNIIMKYVDTILLFCSVVAASGMLIVAGISRRIEKESTELQEKMYKLQEKYDRAALCPRCDIVCSEANQIIKISLYNYGMGTMTIDDLDILNKETKSLFHNIYEIIPSNIGLTYYSLETKGRNISVGGHIKLIEIDRSKLNTEACE